ncbi:unnamed protein product [Candidula unifasciata]|uniref:Uncharacterized protein n=1 Tax=Candidula unifasciata TaxID=100452 RepID=A0A8S3ZY65_9EUPU|nr:unnamed protein product [Candidula unifasciata]
MAEYQKIDADYSDHSATAKSNYYRKEEHLEIDLFQREADLHHRRLTCSRNPGHENFIPIPDLTLDCFPEALRHQEVLDYVVAFSKLVVRLKVKHTSGDRPKNDPFQNFIGRDVLRGATGCVIGEVDMINIEEFPCRDDGCLLQGCVHSVYGFIDVLTNCHVVHDAKEARFTEVEFFFDAPDRFSVVTLKGHEVKRISRDEERVVVRCVTHDIDFLKKLYHLVETAKSLGLAIPRSVKDSSMTDFAIIVSHPHGSVKGFSIGRLLEYRKTPEKTGMLKRFLRQAAGKRPCLRVTTYTTPTCPGCTGAPVVTGYDDGWGWWSLSHSTADLNSGINMAFSD